MVRLILVNPLEIPLSVIENDNIVEFRSEGPVEATITSQRKAYSTFVLQQLSASAPQYFAFPLSKQRFWQPRIQARRIELTVNTGLFSILS